MKTPFFLIVGFLLLLTTSSASSQDVSDRTKDSQKESVSILSTPDLYDLTSMWAREYNNLNRQVEINVISTDNESKRMSMTDNLVFVSNKNDARLQSDSEWKLLVGRDIIVPVLNIANPFYDEIQKQGVSKEKLALMFKNEESRNWGTLLSGRQKEPVHLFIANDEDVKTVLSKFLEMSPTNYSEISIGSREEIITAIQKDPLAIGFCNVIDIQNFKDQSLIANIGLLPIDKNGNGTIDYIEKIYTDLNTFQRGVWIGKYPKTLVKNIYAVREAQPTNETELDFLKWIVTDGQQYLNAIGHSELVNNESQSQLDKLTLASVKISPVKDASDIGIILLIVAALLTVGAVTSALIRNYRKQKNIIPDFNVRQTGFGEGSVVLPQGLYFDKTHTWAFMEKDGNVTVGIDDFLQHVTGPITRVEMKQPGDHVKKGNVLFSIVQFGKQLNIYAPFTGIIKRQNEELQSDLSVLNFSPYDKGWIYKIEPSNWIKEVQLMDLADKYRRWLNAEFSRLKEFMTAILKPESPEYAHIVLQDGGELKEGLLADFGPEVWEDFQANFLDTFK